MITGPLGTLVFSSVLPLAASADTALAMAVLVVGLLTATAVAVMAPARERAS